MLPRTITVACANAPVTKLPGFQKASTTLSTDTCFAQPGHHSVALFAPFPTLDQLNCSLATLLQIANSSRPSRSLLDILAIYLVPTAFVLVYESFRPVHSSLIGYAARATPALLLLGRLAACYFGTCYGGGLGAAVGVTAFFALASLSTVRGGAKAHAEALRAPKPGAALLAAALPRPAGAWGTLLAVVGGYVVPVLPLYLQRTQWSFDALSLRIHFPIYVPLVAFVAARIFPPLIGWCATEGSRAYAVIGMTLVGLIASLVGHLRLIFGPEALADVLLLRPSPRSSTPAYAAHVDLLIEMAVLILATSSFVLTADGGSGPDVRGRFLLFGLLSCALGPGGALALMWGYREVCLTFAYERIAYGDEARLEEDEGEIERE